MISHWVHSLRRGHALAIVLLLWGGGAAADPVKLSGRLVQGGLVRGEVLPGSQVFLDGKPVRTTAAGAFAIGFDRDAPGSALLEVVSAQGERQRQQLSVEARQYAVQSITGVPQRTVEPPPEQLARIREEQRAVEQARATSSDREDFLAAFQWPLKGRISGVYGSQRIYNGTPGRPHYGVDVAAPVGTAVRAPAAGKVTLAHKDMFFSGGTLIMDHGYGISSTFIHLNKLLVEEGAEVRAGDIVAEVGATGRATGPHLDWRINWFGVRLDPQLVVPALDE